jgi:uncharacterized C2H2 Zn-finger protein
MSFKCLRCGKVLYSKSHLERHESRCRGFGLQCPLCLSIYPSFQAFRVHVRGHGDLWNRFPICNRRFKLTIAHYSGMKDDDHKMLWALTVGPRVRGRTREPRTVRGLLRSIDTGMGM